MTYTLIGSKIFMVLAANITCLLQAIHSMKLASKEPFSHSSAVDYYKYTATKMGEYEQKKLCIGEIEYKPTIYLAEGILCCQNCRGERRQPENRLIGRTMEMNGPLSLTCYSE